MPALSTTPTEPGMVERGKRYKTRPFRDSDAPFVWRWFQEAGWRGFSWTTWTLASDVSSYRQWVTVNEYDRPVSYIAIGQQSWGQFVAGYITSKKYRNQGIGSNLWIETVGKMRDNVGLTSVADMVKKYATRSNMRHISPVEIITFKGRVTFLDTLKTLPKGLFNPHFKVYPIQDDRTIDKVIAYDRRTFSKGKIDKSREEFLWKWMRRGRVTIWDPAPKVLSLCAENPVGAVVGYGSISPASGASKIAPLYADSPEIARTLMTELLKLYNCTVTPIDQIIMNVPDNKNGFIDFLNNSGLVVSLKMQQAFTKEVPKVDYDRIFCIASQFCQLY